MNDTLGSRSNDSLNALVGLNESSTLFGSTTSAVPLRAPLWIPPAMIRLSRVGAPLAKLIPLSTGLSGKTGGAPLPRWAFSQAGSGSPLRRPDPMLR